MLMFWNLELVGKGGGLICIALTISSKKVKVDYDPRPTFLKDHITNFNP
jgi:hypothetical protein